MSFKTRESREPSADAPPSPAPAETAQEQPAHRGGGLVVVLSVPNEPSAKVETGENVVSDRMLDRRTQAAIGQQLRTLYNDLATEPVPDHLLKLLETLEQKNTGSNS